MASPMKGAQPTLIGGRVGHSVQNGTSLVDAGVGGAGVSQLRSTLPLLHWLHGRGELLFTRPDFIHIAAQIRLPLTAGAVNPTRFSLTLPRWSEGVFWSTEINQGTNCTGTWMLPLMLILGLSLENRANVH